MSEIIYIALAAGAVVAAIVCFTVVKRYKGGSFSPIYPLEHYTKLDLREREDRFLNRHVTRVKVSSSNDKK